MAPPKACPTERVGVAQLAGRRGSALPSVSHRELKGASGRTASCCGHRLSPMSSASRGAAEALGPGSGDRPRGQGGNHSATTDGDVGGWRSSGSADTGRPGREGVSAGKGQGGSWCNGFDRRTSRATECSRARGVGRDQTRLPRGPAASETSVHLVGRMSAPGRRHASPCCLLHWAPKDAARPEGADARRDRSRVSGLARAGRPRSAAAAPTGPIRLRRRGAWSASGLAGWRGGVVRLEASTVKAARHPPGQGDPVLSGPLGQLAHPGGRHHWGETVGRCQRQAPQVGEVGIGRCARSVPPSRGAVDPACGPSAETRASALPSARRTKVTRDFGTDKVRL
jgi:hypothetical protein